MIPDYNRRIAANLAVLRKLAGWSRARLADELGWTPGVVALAEMAAGTAPMPSRRTHRQFSVDELFLIAGVFRVPVLDLLRQPGACRHRFTCQACGAQRQARRPGVAA